MRTDFFLTLFVQCTVCFCLIYVNCTLSPKTSKGAKGKTNKIKLGPVNHSVIDRNLVTEDLTVKDILNNHQAYFRATNKKTTNGMVLGYVTPWNNHGYDIAKIFANKFTHISPTWLQIKRKGVKNYQFTGLHDIDQNWMSAVWKAGMENNVKIVPRVLFDGWHVTDLNDLFSKEEEMKALAVAVVKLCKKWSFDGIVLEVWSQAGGHLLLDKHLVNFTKYLGRIMAHKNLDYILVIPPRRGEGNDLFSSANFNALYDYVTAFSLMSYDFSTPQRPGPNAPYKWIEDNIRHLCPNVERRGKLLTGLNFYGQMYTPNGARPIVGHEFLRAIKGAKTKFVFDSVSREHFIDVRKTDDEKYLIFYPTLMSIATRLDMFERLQTGISIWELGQGLDYFYDLL